MTNMEWLVLNKIAATDLYCMRDSRNSCYVIKDINGLVYSEFEDDATDFNKVILDWLATVFRKDCDVIFEGYKVKVIKREKKKRKKKLKK